MSHLFKRRLNGRRSIIAVSKPAIFTILSLSLTCVQAGAQTRPDLSGTWTASTDTPASVGAAPTPILGAKFELKHSGDNLTMIRIVRDVATSVQYTLDNREIRSRLPAPLCMGQAESIETAAWDGSSIVLTIVGSMPAGATTPNKLSVRRVLRLEAPDRLVVEGTMGAAETAKTVGTVYKRSTETLSAPEPKSIAPKVKATIGQMGWLAGTWVGTLGRNTIEERWTPSAGGAMIATARTMRDGLMGQFEFLCIVERDGGLVYQAMPNGRQPATDFALTAMDANSVTFENPMHDFPKVVKYVLQPDGTLEATISGDPKQRALTYSFKKQ